MFLFLVGGEGGGLQDSLSFNRARGWGQKQECPETGQQETKRGGTIAYVSHQRQCLTPRPCQLGHANTNKSQ